MSNDMPEVENRGVRRGYYAIKAALLGYNDPIGAMRAIAIFQLQAGIPRESVLATFEALRAEQRESNNEDREELVMTVMDHLVGWCRPDLAL